MQVAAVEKLVVGSRASLSTPPRRVSRLVCGADRPSEPGPFQEPAPVTLKNFECFRQAVRAGRAEHGITGSGRGSARGGRGLPSRLERDC